MPAAAPRAPRDEFADLEAARGGPGGIVVAIAVVALLGAAILWFLRGGG